MKIAAIVQARLNSSRLPGKVLMSLGNKTVLAHVINRLSMCRELDGVIVATPDNDVIKESVNNGAQYYKGDELDVLCRYYHCSKFFGVDRIIRVTADCPFIMPDLVDKLVRGSKKYDYGSNVVTRTYPQGFDCEIFSFEDLRRAFIYATDPYDREHVTSYMKRCLVNYSLRDEDDYSHKRITLDTLSDYNDLVEYNKVIGEIYSYTDCKKLLDKLVPAEK